MTTVSAMKPNFTTPEEYRGWRNLYRLVYDRLTADIRRQKIEAKDAQRAGLSRDKQRALHFNRRTAFKMMTLLQDAKVRLGRIRAMQKEIAEQEFPLNLPDVRNVDFHFNKGNIEFPFLPLWVIRAKGRSYYVNEVDFSAPCTTKERASGSTKGVLRFRRCSVSIDAKGNAVISEYTPATATLENVYSDATA